jgi:hypothetical protein
MYNGTLVGTAKLNRYGMPEIQLDPAILSQRHTGINWKKVMPTADQMLTLMHQPQVQQQGMQPSAGGTAQAGGGGGGAQMQAGGGGQLTPVAGEMSALQALYGLAGQPGVGLDPKSLANLQNQMFNLGFNPQAIPGGTPPPLSSIPGYDPSQIAGGNLPMTGPDAGLYPAQSAMIDAQTQAAQAATQQQLANMGLGASTQGTLLSGELAQQGAAAKGQLIQQNIQEAQAATALGQSAQQVYQQYLQLGQSAQNVAQNWTKLGMGEQAISMQEQQNQFSQFQQVAAQFAQAQSQFWTEGVQGMGMLGDMFKNVLSAYGLEANTLKQETDASLQQAALDAQVEEASMKSQADASSSLFSGLGSLLGGLGGAGAAAGGGGSAIGGILSGVLGALFSF